MTNKGKLIATHGASRFRSTMMVIVGSAFLCLGLTLPLLLFADGTQEGVGQLIAIASVLLVSLGGFFLFLRTRIRPDYTFELYDNGLVTTTRRDGTATWIPFDQLDDVYRFVTGRHSFINTMAVRNSGSTDWSVVYIDVVRSLELQEAIIDRQLRHRLPKLLVALARGEEVVFQRISERQRFSKRMFATGLASVLKVTSSPIVLRGAGLEADGARVPFNEIATVDFESPMGAIILRDANGNVRFSVPYLSLVGADLFVTVMRELTAPKQSPTSQSGVTRL